MDKILLGIALRELNKFCLENDVDISGTSVKKQPRKWRYFLYKVAEDNNIACLTFGTDGTFSVWKLGGF